MRPARSGATGPPLIAALRAYGSCALIPAPNAGVGTTPRLKINYPLTSGPALKLLASPETRARHRSTAADVPNTSPAWRLWRVGLDVPWTKRGERLRRM